MEVDNEENLVRMKEVLKEAGLYENDMSKEEISDACRLIEESKNSANEENETRQALEKSEADLLNTSEGKSNSTDTLSSESVIDEMSSAKNEMENSSDVERPVLDATKYVFGYTEMTNYSEQNLNIIVRSTTLCTIHDIPFFVNATLCERIHLLNRYFKYLNFVQDRIARQIFEKAPLPDAIKLNVPHDVFPDFNNEEDTYISRSGRQTKRKNYYDQTEDIIGDTKLKKSKTSEETIWLSKSEASKLPIKSTLKSKKNDPTPQRKHNELSEKEDLQEVALLVSSTPRQRATSSSKKLCNDDIMKRSALFSDTPVRSTRNAPSRRSEVSFDKLKDVTNKKEQTEKNIERFEETLEQLPQDSEEAEFKIQEEEHNDVVVVNDVQTSSRRVIPPLPVRRPPIQSKKTAKLQSKQPAKSKDPKKNEAKEQQVKHEENNVSIRKRRLENQTSFDDIQIDNEPSTSQNVKPTFNLICPICFGSFSQETIQKHASSCGEDAIITKTSTKFQHITCELCGKVLPLNTEYEMHTKKCRRQREEMDREKYTIQ